MAYNIDANTEVMFRPDSYYSNVTKKTVVAEPFLVTFNRKLPKGAAEITISGDGVVQDRVVRVPYISLTPLVIGGAE
tara:strand:- start:1176 stop:1406 length:231 start_codon:yes stop_codon:yes gene_type:complete